MDNKFKVIYNDDLTHILTCDSPYHQKGEAFREEMIFGTVDEVAEAGADIHMLQPGLCWCPLWPSKVLPFKEHFEWIQNRYGGPKDRLFDEYVLGGGDIAGVFINRCREKGTLPYISIRMNDYHYNELLDFTKEQLAGWKDMPMTLGSSKFQMEHKDWRIGPEEEAAATAPGPSFFEENVGLRWRTRVARVLNWKYEDVRNHKFELIEELCTNYQLDGLELDFMRHSNLFSTNDTTSEERVQIMTNFCQKVREMLDKTSSDRNVILGVRIPLHQEIYDSLGIDISKWHNVGVDFFNLSCHYAMEQQTQLPEIKKLAPEAEFYLEMTHTPMRLWRDNSEEFRMTTPEQFRTTALVANQQGASGVSLFNFMYYRRHGERGRNAVYSEPPFEVISEIKDSEKLREYPQHYFFGPGSNNWGIPGFPLPQRISQDKPGKLTVYMVPPSSGWNSEFRLRIQAKAKCHESELEVLFNNTTLEKSDNISELFPNKFNRSGGLGEKDELKSWALPSALVYEGNNKIELKLKSGEDVEIVFVDIG